MEAVIFDFNGTLLLDDEINMIAWKKYSKRKFNYDLSEEEYLKYNGTPGEIWIEGITKGKITGEEAIKCREEKEQQYRDELREADIDLIKGAKNFFEELKKNKIPYTIATSSNKLNVELYFEKFGLSQWFDFDKITFTDGTFKGKPNPDVYLIAAEKLGVDIKKCIVFEDTKNGVKSAYTAGATVIGMTSGKPSDEVWKYEKVVDVINDFTEVNIDKLNNLFK